MNEPTSCEWHASPEPGHVIREKVRTGQQKRKHLKKGTLKRLAGNCTALLTSVVLFTSCVFAVGSEFSRFVFGDRRVDVLEIFGGAAEVSMQFSKRGWHVLQPIDLQYGHDLKDPAVREEVFNLVVNERPRLVIISWPRKFWSKLCDVNYSTPQRRRKLNQLRVEERPFLELTERIFEEQIKNDCDAVAENPLASHAFKEPPIKRLLNRPEINIGISHGCRFGLRHPQNDLFLKKPTLWIATSPEIANAMSLRCENRQGRVSHHHAPCQGGHVTQHAAKYTKEMAQALHRGFVQTIKRKDPQRIHYLLQSVGKRFRNGLGKDVLVWDPQKVDELLGHNHSVFANQGGDVGAVDVAQYEPGESLDSGITFEVPVGSKLDPGARTAIKKLHCNLGHPGTKDLQRFLRNGGAPQSMVEAVGWLKCASCARTQRPRLHRVVRIPPHDIQFNDQVMIDCFHVKDSKHQGHWFMSILDRATMYHLVSRIENHSPDTFINVFFRDWVKWAGNPMEVTIDLESGLGGQAFATALGESGIQVVPIAGQAHWQHGKIERHGGVLKDMLRKVLIQNDCHDAEQVGWMANEVTMAKNMLAMKHGYFPSQLLFGREPRLYGEIEENGEPCGFHFGVGDRGTQLAKRLKFRNEARQGYIQAQAKHMINQTARNKTRPWKEPQIGDRCFFFRETKIKGSKGVHKRWLGPALVVGVQGQSNLWIVFGGRCFLVAQEHTREAVGEEALYGKPEVQEALSIFRNLGDPSKTHEYKDLTQQSKIKDDDMDVDVEHELHDSDEELIPADTHPGYPHRIRALPDELLPLCKVPGWKEDALRSPVCVSYKSYAYRVLPPKFDSSRYPYRTTWGYWNGNWRLLEEEVRWTHLENSSDLIIGGPADILISIFHSRTRKQICLDSVPACMKKQKIGSHEAFLSLSQRK